MIGTLFSSPLVGGSDALVAAPGDMTTLVVHCSDGRFGNQCDRFIHSRLQQAMYDRLVVPGGAAWLANHLDMSSETSSARSALELLVEVHCLSRVVLIAHAGCAFYLRKLAVPPERCESRQRADLLAVGRWLRQCLPQVQVAAYYAHRCGRRVLFKSVFGAGREESEPRPPRFSMPLAFRPSPELATHWPLVGANT